MWRDVPDSIDRFPGDFTAALRVGAGVMVASGFGAWWLARSYMERTYPAHSELMGAAIVVGAMDGVMLGVAAFVLTYVIRVWRYERRLRTQSDEALRRELARLHLPNDDETTHRP